MNKMGKLNMNLGTMDIIQGVMSLYNYRDTAGMVLFRGGGALKILSFFDFFQEEWTAYKSVMTCSGDEVIRKYLEKNNGGIATNGSLFIDLKDVVAMLKTDNMTLESETD